MSSCHYLKMFLSLLVSVFHWVSLTCFLQVVVLQDSGISPKISFLMHYNSEHTKLMSTLVSLDWNCDSMEHVDVISIFHWAETPDLVVLSQVCNYLMPFGANNSSFSCGVSCNFYCSTIFSALKRILAMVHWKSAQNIHALLWPCNCCWCI